MNLNRNGAWCASATTWGDGHIALKGSAYGKDDIIGDILDRVDIFSNDFLSVNESD